MKPSKQRWRYEDMIYRFHVFEEVNDDRVQTTHSDFSLNSALSGLPEQLNWILDEAEVLNEILDLEKQESYLKITTELEKNQVMSAITKKLSLNGLAGTLIG
ncbi:MAG: hypothetical protein ACI9P7_000834 [Candidatus Azotimanducaceae bacterium]|jgi:hypothetical protein